MDSKRKKASAMPLRKRYLCTSSVLEELTFLPVWTSARSKRENALCIAPPQGGVAAIEHTRFHRAKKPKGISCVWNKFSTSFQSQQLLMPINILNNIRNEVVLLANNCRWLVPEVDETRTRQCCTTQYHCQWRTPAIPPLSEPRGQQPYPLPLLSKSELEVTFLVRSSMYYISDDATSCEI